MKKVELRIYYMASETDAYVAEDGENFVKIVPDRDYHDYDDYVCSVSVIPGVSRIKLVSESLDIDEYFWSFFEAEKGDCIYTANGDGANACVIRMPEDLKEKTTLYVEEGNYNVDYLYDSRIVYFKNEKEKVLLRSGMIDVICEDI